MVTDYKQSTIGEMVESERLLVLEAHERYPAFYPHAEEAVHFLSTFVRSIKADRHIFGSFLSHLKKHAMLALFSTVRLHRVQAMMDLRQVLERERRPPLPWFIPNTNTSLRLMKRG